MHTKTMEGLIGARTNMDMTKVPMRVYKEARRKGDTATMERSMGYVHEFEDKAYQYKDKASEGMKEEAKEAREQEKLKREQAIEEQRKERKEAEAKAAAEAKAQTTTDSLSATGINQNAQTTADSLSAIGIDQNTQTATDSPSVTDIGKNTQTNTTPVGNGTITAPIDTVEISSEGLAMFMRSDIHTSPVFTTPHGTEEKCNLLI